MLSILPQILDQEGWPWDMESTNEQETLSIDQLPKISIVTPSYNQGQYIEKTIRSVLLQKYPNLEYIIIDGGSTDNSVEIIEKYSPWITYWQSEKDNGQTDAINQGLKRTTGEIVAYINSDDFYLPNAFYEVAKAFMEGKKWITGAVYYTYDKVDKDLRRWEPSEDTSPNDLLVWLARGGGLPQPGVFWSQSFLQSYGFFREDMHYCFDTEYWLRLLFKGETLSYLSQDFAKRIIHPDCKTELNPENFDAEFHKISRDYLEKLPESQASQFPAIQAQVRARQSINSFRQEMGQKNYSKASKSLMKAFSYSPSSFIKFALAKFQKGSSI